MQTSVKADPDEFQDLIGTVLSKDRSTVIFYEDPISVFPEISVTI